MRFVKGGASGCLSGALLQPLQVIKTSMQVSAQDKAKYLKGAEQAAKQAAEEAVSSKKRARL
jgi:hypothetical protein